MELVNEFRVAVPIEAAWNLLTDLERIAPCMPGAELLSVDGEEYRGALKVKVGPITAQYKGKATFQEKDKAAWRAVIKADGRETRGQGNASAIITAALREDGDGTAVLVSTNLNISGKAAQFGRGVLADVSAKLLQQFVRCLEADVLAGAPAEAPVTAAAVPATDETAPNGSTPSASPVSEAAPEPAEASPVAAVPASGNGSSASAAARPAAAAAEPVNLLGAVGLPVAKRAAPVAAVAVTAYLLGRWGSKGRRQG